MRSNSLILGVAAAAITLLLAAAPTPLRAQQPALQVGATDLGGVVTGPGGPEAGVWVIAETTDLPTKFAKIVVTDDRGRYLIPELPKANYSVWVRGYGLVDSPKVRRRARPDAQPHRRARAERGCGGRVLPADLLVLDAQDPGEERVPARADEDQARVAEQLKTNGCMSCHALGSPARARCRRTSATFQDFDRSVGAAHHGRAGA